MAHYLVRAQAKDLTTLKEQLDSGEIRELRPFGDELHQVLLDARVDGDWITWEENCFCHPPLKQERSVLDMHFSGLTTETIRKGEGWKQIEDLPRLWAEGS